MNITKYDLDLLIAVNQLNNISINIVIYLKEFHIAMETEINNNYQENQKPNINRNKLINEALRNFLAQLSLVIIFRSFYFSRFRKN